jgi:hypothetical protein
VHDSAHLRRRNEDAVLQTLDAKKAVAGAIRADGPFDRAAWLRGDAVPRLVALTARSAPR